MKILRHILLSLFILACADANAQVGASRRDFSVGVSGGYTLNRMSFSPSIKQAFKGGPMFGFTARYICEKYFNSICGIQLEANYQDLGWKEIIEDGTNNQYTRNLRFIEVPFLMQMGWGKERKGLKFLLEAGPYIQYNIGSSEKKVGDPWIEDYRPNGVTYQYHNDIDNKIAYGIEAGLGVEFSSVVGHFILGGRYCYGLGDLYDNSKKGYFARSANGTIEIKLTYLFDIIKTNLDK